MEGVVLEVDVVVFVVCIVVGIVPCFNIMGVELLPPRWLLRWLLLLVCLGISVYSMNGEIILSTVVVYYARR
jgi:hypothetical protein